MMLRILLTSVLAALVACSSPPPEVIEARDARAEAPPEDNAAPPAVDGNITPPVTPDSGNETPCVQLPADTLPIGDDDCFAYELVSRCAPYECGRDVHYFCADALDGSPQMPLGDCRAAGTTFHGPSTHGYCCTAATCVRDRSADALCPSGEVARSCPTVAADAGAGCTRVSESERGDPVFCCVATK